VTRLELSRAFMPPEVQDRLFRRVAGLRVLDLSGSRTRRDRGLPGALAASLGALAHLTELYLCDLRLDAFPGEQLKGLGRLRVLDLSCNRIAAVPDEVACLTSLRRLKMKVNKLEHLTSKMGELGNLEHLDVSFNSLRTLPESLERCPRLRDVECLYTRMKGIPLWLLKKRVRQSERKGKVCVIERPVGDVKAPADGEARHEEKKRRRLSSPGHFEQIHAARPGATTTR